jgi:hypothetical protein
MTFEEANEEVVPAVPTVTITDVPDDMSTCSFDLTTPDVLDVEVVPNNPAYLNR